MVENRRVEESDLDLVLDFGAGLLDEAERADVVARCRRDPAFEALLRQHLGDAEAALLDRRMVRRSNWSRWLRFGAPLAAAAVVVIAVTTMRPGRNEGSQEYWIQIPWQATVSRGEADAEALQAGIEAYESRDLEHAIELLEPLRLQNGQEDLRRLYLASALLLSGQAQRGRRMLEELNVETLPRPWREEAERLLH